MFIWKVSKKKKKSIVENINEAANDCYLDALRRWKKPYRTNNLDKMTYKIEILDEKKDWSKIYDLKDLKDEEILLFMKSVFNHDGTQGVYLMLREEGSEEGSEEIKIKGSATFLPVVSRDYKNKWSVEKYMENLSEKAGGKKNDWKKGIFQTYKSISFKFKIIDKKDNIIEWEPRDDGDNSLTLSS